MEKNGILEFERHGDIIVLTLNAPHNNSRSGSALADPDVIRSWLCETGLKGAVITGSGNNFFEYADYTATMARKSEALEISEDIALGKRALLAISNSPVPVVAAIRGLCLGAGLEIALACHLRVVSHCAVMGFTEASHGIMPCFGGTLSVETVGLKNVMPLLLPSERISGSQARELGLVQHVALKKDVFGKALEILDAMTKGKPRRR